LQLNQLKNWHLIGKALSIELDGEEVQLEEALSLYDGESEAFCGLEDFRVTLQSWRVFLTE
jgi:uncharacterized protein YacL (UPF0231 family)